MGELNKSLHILIMAGGSGTRFWPKSRSAKPKQLIALYDQKSMIEKTVERFSSITSEENIWIITTEKLLNSTKEILKKYKSIRYLAEPSGKNTAPCILWGVNEIARVDTNAVVAVMPSDHYIGKENEFISSLKIVIQTSINKNAILVLGIQPNKPETGYGYIEASTVQSDGIAEVIRFVEKPKIEIAKKYLDSKNFFWNAGMFVFPVKLALSSFESCMPSLFQKFKKNNKNYSNTYSEISNEEAISIDYGVMEKAKDNHINVMVRALDCDWNDLGSFTALEAIQKETQGDVIAQDSHSNIALTDSGIIALLGVENLIVVRDGNIVMVADKNKSQEVKTLLEKVKLKFPNEA